MTTHIAIYERVADLPKEKRESFIGLPENYPVNCEEFSSEDEAKKKYPNARIMTLEAYKGYSEAVSEFWAIKKQESDPWWKIW